MKGLPLINHTINYLKKVKLIDDIIISTDDKVIAQISEENNCFTIFPRPTHLSNDKATSEAALSHALKIYEEKVGKTDIITFVQTTEFFKAPKILERCIKVLKKDKKIDSCFAAYEQHKNFFGLEKKVHLREFHLLMRDINQDKKKVILREDTGLGLATRSKFIRKNERIGNKVTCITYSNPLYSLDLNHNDDLKLIKKILK